MKKMILTGLTAAVLSANAFAGEVTGYTAPQSGQAATAAGVDANFQALITAINDNNSRIAALEAASGEVTDLNTVVSGSVYRIYFAGMLSDHSVDTSSNHFEALEHWGGETQITFYADGDLEESFNEHGRWLPLDYNNTTDEAFVDNTTTAKGGDWYVSGRSLFILWPEDEAEGSTDYEEFMLSSDGEMIVKGGGGTDEYSDQFGSQKTVETFMAVGMKLPAPE